MQGGAPDVVKGQGGRKSVVPGRLSVIGKGKALDRGQGLRAANRPRRE